MAKYVARRDRNPIVQRILDMNDHEAAALLERMQQPVLDRLRDDYVQGRIDVDEYEGGVERVLNGFLNEPTEQDRAIAAMLLGRRRRLHGKTQERAA